MPLNKYFGGHGASVMKEMQAKHGKKAGERIFYATANKKKSREAQPRAEGEVMGGPSYQTPYPVSDQQGREGDLELGHEGVEAVHRADAQKADATRRRPTRRGVGTAGRRGVGRARTPRPRRPRAGTGRDESGRQCAADDPGGSEAGGGQEGFTPADEAGDGAGPRAGRCRCRGSPCWDGDY